MRRGCILLSIACLLALPLAAESPAAREYSWGLVFNLGDILSLESYQDGYQAGAGLKYRFGEELALRGLLGIYCNEDDEADTEYQAIGLGLAAEWHLAPAPVSPYAGALAGARFLSETDEDNKVDLYFGALFGVELELYRNLSLLAEYELVASFDAEGSSVSLGVSGTEGEAGGALLGLVVYF